MVACTVVARKVPPIARPSFREEKRALVAKWKFMVAARFQRLLVECSALPLQ